jgi:hypothetical protein
MVRTVVLGDESRINMVTYTVQDITKTVPCRLNAVARRTALGTLPPPVFSAIVPRYGARCGRVASVYTYPEADALVSFIRWTMTTFRRWETRRAEDPRFAIQYQSMLEQIREARSQLREAHL